MPMFFEKVDVLPLKWNLLTPTHNPGNHGSDKCPRRNELRDYEQNIRGGRGDPAPTKDSI